ncbi:hypothetical protein D9M69_567370 [compost metagenome]
MEISAGLRWLSGGRPWAICRAWCWMRMKAMNSSASRRSRALCSLMAPPAAALNRRSCVFTAASPPASAYTRARSTMGTTPLCLRSIVPLCSPLRAGEMPLNMPSGGVWVSALPTMCARKMVLPLVRSSTSRRRPSSSALWPCTARRSKNTQVSMRALGSGWPVQRAK